jgi:hypothetical protein
MFSLQSISRWPLMYEYNMKPVLHEICLAQSQSPVCRLAFGLPFNNNLLLVILQSIALQTKHRCQRLVVIRPALA